jgi:hypothetical protein
MIFVIGINLTISIRILNYNYKSPPYPARDPFGRKGDSEGCLSDLSKNPMNTPLYLPFLEAVKK